MEDELTLWKVNSTKKPKCYTQQRLRNQLETSSFRSLWGSFRGKIEKAWRFKKFLIYILEFALQTSFITLYYPNSSKYYGNASFLKTSLTGYCQFKDFCQRQPVKQKLSWRRYSLPHQPMPWVAAHHHASMGLYTAWSREIVLICAILGKSTTNPLEQECSIEGMFIWMNIIVSDVWWWNNLT